MGVDKMIKLILIVFLLGSFGCKDKAKNVVARNVNYDHEGKTMRGYLAFDQTVSSRRPAVLLIHEWTGLGEYVQKRARMIAELGYNAFAMDMYGEGRVAKDHEEAKRLMDKYVNDPELMLSRIRKALEIIKENPMTDTEKIAVIGYCFGGGAALALAFSGEPIKGVVSFHGMLAPPAKDEAKKVRSKLLIHHGADDRFIPQETVEKFQEILKIEKVDFEFVSHEGAVHGFTRWSAGNDTSTGIAYNKKADESSWASMKIFLESIF